MYPIKVRINSQHLEEFQSSEYGYYEDAGSPKAGEPWIFEGFQIEHWDHVYNILDRHKGTIEMRNEDEVKEVYFALCSGTYQLHYLRTAIRVADEIIKKFGARPVAEWYPSGF